MKKIVIDDDFKNLIPPLSNEEFSQLEENILKHGIQDPLKIWNGTLIDGHNRYEIATKHNLRFDTLELTFKDREEVKEWIILNQFGRRNISAYERVCLALKMKPVLATKAKENSLANLKQVHNKKKSDVPILASRTTNEKLAKIAGVGKETIRKVEKIQEISKQVRLDDILAGLKRGEVSINLAYETAMYRLQQRLQLEDEMRTHLEEIKKTADTISIYYGEVVRREKDYLEAGKIDEYHELKNECEQALNLSKILLPSENPLT